MKTPDNERLARIDQKLTDFMNMYKEHRADDIKYRESLDTDMQKIKKFKERIERPMKWAGAAVTLSAAGTFAYFGEKFGRWILHR